MNTLPDKISALIRVARDDLIKCEENPNYIIDMSQWHNYQAKAETCSVCLAGAVMAQTLDLPITSHAITLFDGLDQSENAKFRALDSIRKGDIVLAGIIGNFDTMAGESNFRSVEYETETAYVSYEDNPDCFKAWLIMVAEALERRGL